MVITRVVFNFTGKCNMRCPFCYVPFDGSRVESADVINAFDAMLTSFQPLSVTVGGGDPSAFKDLDVLLRMARARTQHVQLDTNGKGLGESRLTQMASDIDLLGLPLDAPTPQLHDQMRKEPGHFALVLRTLANANGLRIPVKVNTVVTRLNEAVLEELAGLVEAVGASRWSLYQFWPMEPVQVGEDALSVSDDAFDFAVSQSRQCTSSVDVEGGSIRSRSPGYVFVRHTGGVYVVDPTDTHRYIELGTVFDETITSRITSYVDLTSQAHRLRNRIE